jgi:hypothetical protein
VPQRHLVPARRRRTLAGGLGEGLGGGQVLAHLLGGGISFGAELVSGGGTLFRGCGAGFGGGGALLGGGADRLDLGLGGGRVGEGVDPLPQPGPQRGDPVGLGAQRP